MQYHIPIFHLKITRLLGIALLLLMETNGHKAFALDIDSLPQLSLQEAIERALAQYPQIQAAKTAIAKQSQMQKTAWQLGNTQVYTAGEEIQPQQGGVYTTIGIQQQNIPVFTLGARQTIAQNRVALAETALSLSQLELKQEVQTAYAQTWISLQNFRLYQSLDSVYQAFADGIQLRYEVEETSQLAYLAASSQVQQISLQRSQARYDFQKALYKLNLWLANDSLFSVKPDMPQSWQSPLKLQNMVEQHPQIALAKLQQQQTQAEYQLAKTSALPQLNAQYGLQQINGEPGYHQYQFGLSIPLFYAATKGEIQGAALSRNIAEAELRETQLVVQNRHQLLKQEYLKWQKSWRYYQEAALPLARKQRQGAVVAFDAGEINYVTFIQNISTSKEMELQANIALQSLLLARFQLEYYQANL